MDVKKILIVAGAGIVLFYIISQPNSAGNTVQGIFGWLRDGAEAIITFLRSLFA